MGIGLLLLNDPPATHFPTVSIVIAARNEADRIESCLKSLEKLDYPEERYEVIFVDDNSTDATPDIISFYQQKHANWRFLRLNRKSQELRGKKNALLTGIAHSRGEIIFTTDADCRVPPKWLKIMTGYFQPGVSMVLGYSPLVPGKGFIYRLLEFDNLFSAIASAAPTRLGYPFTSVGRNLAYRKSAYKSAGTFLALKQFRSGDDVHLTERFRYLKTGKIEFCAHPDTFVETVLPVSIREIFHAQLRKHSKILKQTFSSVAFFISLFLYSVFLLTFPFLVPLMWKIWTMVMGMRFAVEFADLTLAAIIFRKTHLIKFFPIMQVIYPFYIIFFSALGILGIYRWKE